MHLRGPANAPLVLAFGFGPSATAAILTRQPAMLPVDIAATTLLFTNGTGEVSQIANLPNSTALFGVGLWAQAVGGLTLPLEASPLTGVVVRPY